MYVHYNLISHCTDEQSVSSFFSTFNFLLIWCRSRTNVHILVFHLTIADSLVSFVTMPLEAGWRWTMQWLLDDLSCRVLMVVRALGYYLSSNILVFICIDRSDLFISPGLLSTYHYLTFVRMETL